MGIVRFLDKIEDKIRQRLSKRPAFYALIAGVAIVLFWRAVWNLADMFSFMTPIFSLILSVVVMLLTGTFVSFFIGERLLLSGLRQEKRIDEKTQEEVQEEGRTLEIIRKEIVELKKEIQQLNAKMKK